MDPAPPGSALVLLLLAMPSPGSCCSFEFNPVSSTIRAHLEAVTPWLLLDYTVEMPENLEQDPQGCARLRPMNVSQLLGALELHLGGLQERPPPPHTCDHLRCTKAPPVLLPPAVPHGVSPPAPHGLVLWGVLGGALVLSAAVWGLSMRRKRGGTECRQDLSSRGTGDRPRLTQEQWDPRLAPP